MPLGECLLRSRCRHLYNDTGLTHLLACHFAGVLEWVEGTVPLGEYLLGSNRAGGAHGRYGGGDWSFPRCREEMQSAKDKRGAFEAVCAHFRPVLRHFFRERFLHPPQWFERCLTYTRSVAASSMVRLPTTRGAPLLLPMVRSVHSHDAPSYCPWFFFLLPMMHPPRLLW